MSKPDIQVQGNEYKETKLEKVEDSDSKEIMSTQLFIPIIVGIILLLLSVAAVSVINNKERELRGYDIQVEDITE